MSEHDRWLREFRSVKYYYLSNNMPMKHIGADNKQMRYVIKDVKFGDLQNYSDDEISSMDYKMVINPGYNGAIIKYAQIKSNSPGFKTYNFFNIDYKYGEISISNYDIMFTGNIPTFNIGIDILCNTNHCEPYLSKKSYVKIFNIDV